MNDRSINPDWIAVAEPIGVGIVRRARNRLFQFQRVLVVKPEGRRGDGHLVDSVDPLISVAGQELRTEYGPKARKTECRQQKLEIAFEVSSNPVGGLRSHYWKRQRDHQFLGLEVIVFTNGFDEIARLWMGRVKIGQDFHIGRKELSVVSNFTNSWELGHQLGQHQLLLLWHKTEKPL